MNFLFFSWLIGIQFRLLQKKHLFMFQFYFTISHETYPRMWWIHVNSLDSHGFAKHNKCLTTLKFILSFIIFAFASINNDRSLFIQEFRTCPFSPFIETFLLCRHFTNKNSKSGPFISHLISDLISSTAKPLNAGWTPWYLAISSTSEHSLFFFKLYLLSFFKHAFLATSSLFMFHIFNFRSVFFNLNFNVFVFLGSVK